MPAFDWQFPYASYRKPILARNIVATAQPLAAQAGLHMLQKGAAPWMRPWPPQSR